MSPAHSSYNERGYIIPIGGAEDRTADSAILQRFVDLCGGGDARIAIIPTASSVGDTGHQYVEPFKDLGAGRTRVLPYVDRKDTEREDWLEKLNSATGIFMTGGNQLRLSTVLGGTQVATAIRRRNAAGVHVAGTSAGAGFLSEHMIAYGEEGFNPRAGMVKVTAGLGLTNRVIVDQHFRQRDRLGRLFTALSSNPFAVGLGLDEDTAAFLGPNNELEVVGSGAMTVVDPSEVEFSSFAEARPGDPICLIGVRLHFLLSGWTYDLETRKAE